MFPDQSNSRANWIAILGCVAFASLLFLASPSLTQAAETTLKPIVIPISFAIGNEDSRGGLIAANVDQDEMLELVVSVPGHIGAWKQDGTRLWAVETDVRVSAGSSESVGLPGHHAPGVQVGDIDGDGRAELLHLDQDSRLHIREGATGKLLRTVAFRPPVGSERWEHLVIANLRGKGDLDLVLQTTNAKGYRVGRYVATYALDNLEGDPLWTTDHFGALAHGPLRVADLDEDGRDEICGFTILGPGGESTSWKYPAIHRDNAGGASFHIDSLFIADVRPDIPGLEVVLLEEGRNYTACVGKEAGLVWWTTNRRQEPQNAAVGEFDPARPGLETWCRSRYDTDQKPWVLDSRGNVIASYEMAQVAPSDWTRKGVEVIWTIDWTGQPTQLAAAKARHESGDVCIFEPITGRFVARFPEKADRLYVADIRGDWREELVVLTGDQLHIYENPAPNPRPDQPRLWAQPHYRRNKMSWNYYSP